MTEKKSERKLFTILMVLVVFSLVVDLISLNTLYNIAESENLKGELATLSGYDSCMEQAKEDLLWAKQQSEQRKEETIADAKKDADAAWYQWKLGATDDPNLQAQADEEFAAAILIFETKRIAAEMQMEADDRLADAEYEEAMDRCEDMYGSEDEPAPDQYYDYESSSMYAADYESSSMYA